MLKLPCGCNPNYEHCRECDPEAFKTKPIGAQPVTAEELAKAIYEAGQEYDKSSEAEILGGYEVEEYIAQAILTRFSVVKK